MRTVVFCLLVACTSIYTTCRKWDCSQTVYTFEGHFKAYPDQDSIHIGDTIWLEATILTQLTNQMTGQVVNYTGAENLGTAIRYLELTGGDILNPGGVPAANYFDHVLRTGTLSVIEFPEKVRAYRFIEEGGVYKFKLGIVPKKEGLFSVSPGNAANVYTRSDKCSKAGFNLTFKDTDQHMYLYEQSRPGYTPSSYERTHMYVFKVY